MSGVDDLFSSEAPAPVRDRLARISVLLGVGLVLNLLGLVCFTGVPGAVLTLVGWHLADEEVSRVENHVLPPDRLPTALRLRRFGFGQMMFVCGSLMVQIFLFGQGFYEWLLGFVAAQFGWLPPATP